MRSLPRSPAFDRWTRRVFGPLRDRAEQAAIVASSREAFIGTARHGLVTSWNPAAEALYGYRADEVVGRPVGRLFAPGASGDLETVLARAWKGEHVRAFDTQGRRHDGSDVDVALIAQPIRRRGRVVGVVLGARANAARRQLDEALASARDEAIEAARLKSQFLATMSHEIRTPMNGVIGLTGLLLDTPLEPRQRRYAEGVRNAGEALLAVINDILDFSKIEAGKLELEAVDFDLAPLVQDVAELVAEGARDKGLEILVSCAPDLPARLRGDTNRIRQVLLNLVANAVKFTPAGEVVVRAESGGRHGDATLVRFEVTDTGIGIPAEGRGQLFQPFSQADASTTRRFGGTGLGLAISAQLVEAMGGTIGLDSEEGRGSRFWFTLPLAPASERSPDPRGSHLLKGIRVLVVDDNETNRLILHTQLESWGLRVEEVDGGAAALAAVATASAAGDPYRLVIADHQMPGMDGVELARRISRDPVGALPALLLLTSGGNIDAGSAREAGIGHRLGKPVRQSDLYDLLVRTVAGPQPPVPEADPTSPEPEVGSRGVVLVAEDNEINQMVALGILAKLGYRADVVADGAQAVSAAGTGRYAAILMDCHMPELDGYHATKAIRSHEAGSARHVPIIAMTAGVLVEDRERALSAGVDDYVSKPVDPATLEAVLDRWVPDLRRPPRPEPDRVADPGGGGDTGPLDPGRLDALRRLGPDDGLGLLPRLAESFLAALPGDTRRIRDLALRAEADALRQAAHRLRGSAANVGAVALAAVCGELESLAATGATRDAPPVLERLDHEARRASEALTLASAGPTL